MVFKGEECKMMLMQWSREAKPTKLIEKTQLRIMELKKGVQTEEVRNELTKLMVELEKLYQDQDMYWRQRGKVAWMKDGDKNTSYFHAQATTREQVNKISGLRDEFGIWVDQKEQMENVVQAYFLQFQMREKSMRCYSHWMLE